MDIEIKTVRGEKWYKSVRERISRERKRNVERRVAVIGNEYEATARLMMPGTLGLKTEEDPFPEDYQLLAQSWELQQEGLVSCPRLAIP